MRLVWVVIPLVLIGVIGVQESDATCIRDKDWPSAPCIDTGPLSHSEFYNAWTGEYVFREFVKIGITPMLSMLSVLNYFNLDSEIEVLVYGIVIIIAISTMHGLIPGIVAYAIFKKLRKRREQKTSAIVIEKKNQ